MTSTTRAKHLIAKLRSGRLRHNPDVAELCRMLAMILDLGDDLDIPAKPATELYRQDRNRYMALYMRWWRHHGQAGEGRHERQV